jgi:hypothetical protein
VVVESRWGEYTHGGILRAVEKRRWRIWGRYRTVEEAQRAIDGLTRKHTYWEFRIRPEDPPQLIAEPPVE